MCVASGHDLLARVAESGTDVIDHGGNQETTHDATGDEGGKGDSEGRAEPQPTAGDTCGGLHRVVRQVAAERGLTEARGCPSSQVAAQHVAADAHVVHELDVSTLPGEHHLRISSQVPESELRTVTVSWTYGVSHPTNSDMDSGVQRRRAELLALQSATL